MSKSVTDSDFLFLQKLLATKLSVFSEAELQLLRKKEEMFGKHFHAMVTRLIAQLRNTFLVTINYAHSLGKMVEQGSYEVVQEDITAEHFPLNEEGVKQVSLVVIQFSSPMKSKDVLVELKKKNLRAATLPELLAFGSAYPEEQREAPIVALGSVWVNKRSHPRVACLREKRSKRVLDLRWLDNIWHGHSCFLAALV